MDLERTEKAELMGLVFLHGLALATWFVPMGTVLDAHGLSSIKAMAFACSAIAALISPLIFGSLADRQIAPIRVLRWTAAASACTAALVAWAMSQRVSPWVILGLIQLQSLCSAPTSSLSVSIVFSRLADSQRQFGPIRALGTLGWMVGCWLVSALVADASPLAFQLSALLWLALAAFTLRIPGRGAPPSTPRHTSLRERMGWDALELLRHRDHRVVFLGLAFFAIPLSAFYPYTPTHLKDLGLERTSAWMSIGQVSEVIAMMGLSWALVRWRFKWVIAMGFGFGLLRYGLYSLDSKPAVLSGLALHGFAFTLSSISAQVYLAQRIDPAWRTRAQALLSLMSAGVGNLVGYLATGAWFAACWTEGHVSWRRFWGALALLVAGVLIYFLIAYRGQNIPSAGQPHKPEL